MRSKTLARLACTAAAFILLSACGTAGPGNSGGYTVADDTAAYPDAVALYETNCLTCHGNALQGRVGSESDLSQVGSRHDKDAIIAIVRDGRDIMPTFKDVLSDEDMQALAAWLSTKK